MELLAADCLDWKELRRMHLYNVRSVAYLFEVCNLHSALQLLLFVGQPSIFLLVCLMCIIFFVVVIQ
jgi:hypothetical protein